MSNESTKSTAIKPKETQVKPARTPEAASPMNEAVDLGLNDAQMAQHNGSLAGQAGLLDRLHAPQRAAMVQRMARTHTNRQMTQIVARSRALQRSQPQPSKPAETESVAPPDWLLQRYGMGSQFAAMSETGDGDGASESVPTLPVQAQMTVNEVNDPFEQEADRMADQVMRMTSDGMVDGNRSDAASSADHEADGSMMQRTVAERVTPFNKVQRSEAADPLGGQAVDTGVEDQIRRAQGGGDALDVGVQRQMEGAFGADFSGVNVHTDQRADQLNRSVQAEAFTTGQDVFFRQGAYQPESEQGQKLIAHELTHVVQQNEGVVGRKADGAEAIQRTVSFIKHKGAEGFFLYGPYSDAKFVKARGEGGKGLDVTLSKERKGEEDQDGSISMLLEEFQDTSVDLGGIAKQIYDNQLQEFISQRLADSLEDEGFDSTVVYETAKSDFDAIFTAETLANDISDEASEFYTRFIVELRMGAFDYGEINLDNEQHLIPLLNDYAKFKLGTFRSSDEDKQEDENAKVKSEKIKELTESKKGLAEDEARQIEEEQEGGEGTVGHGAYTTALLGTGISIAHYIHTHRPDPATTIIIGEDQPWNPSAELDKSRGISFINHPMHMISIFRRHLQMLGREDGKDETFEGNAQALSDEVNLVLEPYEILSETITNIRKDEEWYRIQTTEAQSNAEKTKDKQKGIELKLLPQKGVYYALKVVSGLGIGPHTAPLNNKRKEKQSLEENWNEDTGVILSIDEFQQQLKNPPTNSILANSELALKPGKIKVGVSGPNAGVDAVHTAMTDSRIGEVVWLAASGPAIAEGMGNAIPDGGKNVTIVLNYLNGWTIGLDEAKKGEDDYYYGKNKFVNMYAGGKKWGNEGWEKAKEKIGNSLPEASVSKDEEHSVDILVYAQGPDTEQVWDIFDPELRKEMGLIDDQNSRFGDHFVDDQNTLLQIVSEVCENQNSFTGHKPFLDKLNKNKDYQAIKDKDKDDQARRKGEKGIADKFEARVQELTLDPRGNLTYAMVASILKPAVGMKVSGDEELTKQGIDNSLEIIGGSGVRILQLISNRIKQLERGQTSFEKGSEEYKRIGKRIEAEKPILKELYDIVKSYLSAELDLSKPSIAPLMQGILVTLSTPTVLNNDQLTPLRAQIEALANYMPTYIGTEESNFATDDRTMIAAQLAAQYSDLPAPLANKITEQIVADRHKRGVKPGTREGTRYFINHWKWIIENEPQLHSDIESNLVEMEETIPKFNTQHVSNWLAFPVSGIRRTQSLLMDKMREMQHNLDIHQDEELNRWNVETYKWWQKHQEWYLERMESRLEDLKSTFSRLSEEEEQHAIRMNSLKDNLKAGIHDLQKAITDFQQYKKYIEC